MDKKYTAAPLDPKVVERIKQFEDELRRDLKSEIVVVAYEEKNNEY